MAIVRMFDLLPEVYRLLDKGGELEGFLDGLQAEINHVHEGELGLRLLQSIFQTPARYLKYIARSLGWKLQSTDEAEMRNECATIIDFYDLKGTPYGIRLMSKLTLDKFFNRIVELYAPVAASASTITETAPDDLQALLDNEGDFLPHTHDENGDVIPNPWDPGAGGTGYDFQPLYSYIVLIRVNPEDYAYGEIRPRIKAFKGVMRRLHPAGRYCYPYIVCQAYRPEHFRKIQDVYEEITGLKTFNDLGHFNDGGCFNEVDEPIDSSVSTTMHIEYRNLNTVDDHEQDPTPEGEYLGPGWGQGSAPYVRAEGGAFIHNVVIDPDVVLAAGLLDGEIWRNTDDNKVYIFSASTRTWTLTDYDWARFNDGGYFNDGAWELHAVFQIA